MKNLNSLAKFVAVAALALACLPSTAEAGKRHQRAAYALPQAQSYCTKQGQRYTVPQAGTVYYNTAQGATYAPPAAPAAMPPAPAPAPVVQPDAPGRVLTTPVLYQATESTQALPPAPAEMKPAEPGMNAVAVEQPAQAAPAQPVYYSDPYGFTDWLNGVRGTYGLGAVGHDPNLSSWAATNNNHQNAYGMGHHVMGPARRQNSGMGAGGTVFQMWMASPAHRAALLDPSISWIGIAASGAYWTFNAY